MVPTPTVEAFKPLLAVALDEYLANADSGEFVAALQSVDLAIDDTVRVNPNRVYTCRPSGSARPTTTRSPTCRGSSTSCG